MHALRNNAPIQDYLTPKQNQFSPYTDNGGTCVAIAGKDFAIIASDTRLSEGYTIYTRDQPKIFRLTDQTVLGSTGCWCDVLTFVRVLQTRIKLYYNDHGKSMSTQSIAQLVSNMLYSKRFFPYYVSNMVVGLDENGAGAIYGYDPVGSFDRTRFLACGSSSPLIQPLLDNRIGHSNQTILDQNSELTLDTATRLIKDSFISAAERDIYCGDAASIQTITKSKMDKGFDEEHFSLRKD
ncbi:Proteasome subunit beta type-1 [Dermatophagoides farinae]|uniref:Proteasome subunit beta type-1 n=1 Tax=Dermatophagoides farinae TaxID=6954 RepID=A0A922I1S7_DERFA|nr:proteasome subunit beta type-1-like [Dermatophagoides farinae]KAH7646835.1 proteasome subunit beta type-1-like protein [Dermatophagoides farinae]KAH9517447.1 Proteasome subunit beta type-1 [Dermatophagoides farinae]